MTSHLFLQAVTEDLFVTLSQAVTGTSLWLYWNIYSHTFLCLQITRILCSEVDDQLSYLPVTFQYSRFTKHLPSFPLQPFFMVVVVLFMYHDIAVLVVLLLLLFR